MSNNSQGFPNPGELNKIKVDAPIRKSENIKMKCPCPCHRDGSTLKHDKPCCDNGYLTMPTKVWTKEEVEANRSKAYKYVI